VSRTNGGLGEMAQRWAGGLAGDTVAVDEMSAPTIRIWHSTDGTWIDKRESDRRAEELRRTGWPELSDVRTRVLENGFVVQATTGHPAGGDRVMFVVQIVTVTDGLVTCVEEYVAPGRRLGDDPAR